MRLLFIHLLFISSTSIFAASNQGLTADLPVVPRGFTKITEVKGDLDKDNIPELVVVYNTKKQTDMGTERQVYIYKQAGSKWQLWHKSIGPVMASQHGGPMGDAFEGIEIQKGCLVVYHMGGGREKWSLTHRYRYQHGNWYLIGATVNYNTSCEGSQNYDYNLSTGLIAAEQTVEKCEVGSEVPVSSKQKKFSFKRAVGKPLLMDGFSTGDNEVKVPGVDEPFYF